MAPGTWGEGGMANVDMRRSWQQAMGLGGGGRTGDAGRGRATRRRRQVEESSGSCSSHASCPKLQRSRSEVQRDN
jgi:hypothetical protein